MTTVAETTIPSTAQLATNGGADESVIEKKRLNAAKKRRKQRERRAKKKAADQLAETNGNTPASNNDDDSKTSVQKEVSSPTSQSTASNESAQENNPPQEKKKKPRKRKTKNPRMPQNALKINKGDDAEGAAVSNDDSDPTENGTAPSENNVAQTESGNTDGDGKSNDKPPTEAQIARKKRQAEKRKANLKKKRAAKKAAKAAAVAAVKTTNAEISNEGEVKASELPVDDDDEEVPADEENTNTVEVYSETTVIAEVVVEISNSNEDDETAPPAPPPVSEEVTAEVEVVETTEIVKEEVVEPTPTPTVTIPEPTAQALLESEAPVVTPDPLPACVSPDRTLSSCKKKDAMMDLLTNDYAKDSKEMNENVKFVDIVPSDSTGDALKAILIGSPGKCMNVSEKDLVAHCMKDMLKNDTAQRAPKKKQLPAEPVVTVEVQQEQQQKAVDNAKEMTTKTPAQVEVAVVVELKEARSLTMTSDPKVNSASSPALPPKSLHKIVVQEPVTLPDSLSSKNAFVPVGELPQDDDSSNDCACVIS